MQNRNKTLSLGFQRDVLLNTRLTLNFWGIDSLPCPKWSNSRCRTLQDDCSGGMLVIACLDRQVYTHFFTRPINVIIIPHTTVMPGSHLEGRNFFNTRLYS